MKIKKYDIFMAIAIILVISTYPLTADFMGDVIPDFFAFFKDTPETSDDVIEYRDIKDYQKFIKRSDCEDCVSHFPKEIPANVKNVEFYHKVETWFGSDYTYLKYQTTKEDVKELLAKYKFINQSEYQPAVIKDMKLTLHDYEFYTIGNYNTLKIKKGHVNQEYGIGVNDKTNEVVFYYYNHD